jgi:hypothetical protein
MDKGFDVHIFWNIITDFFVTAFEMLVLPMSLLNISAGLGMLDRDVLRS